MCPSLAAARANRAGYRRLAPAVAVRATWRPQFVLNAGVSRMPMPTHGAPRVPFTFFWRRAAAAALFAALTTLTAGVLAPAPALAKTPPPKAVFDASAVATPDRFSADAAQQIFAAGGNAVDAAVAIA